MLRTTDSQEICHCVHWQKQPNKHQPTSNESYSQATIIWYYNLVLYPERKLETRIDQRLL